MAGGKSDDEKQNDLGAGEIGDGADGGGGGGDGSAPMVDEADGVGVPAHVALRCAERAEAAEERAESLQARVQELESSLAASRAEVERLGVEREMDAALSGAGVVDAETARLLASAVMERGECSCASEAVEMLRETKPFLFTGDSSAAGSGSAASAAPGPGAGMSGAAMSGLGHGGGSLAEALAAAEEAAATGDRRALLRYLRLRRQRG
jgi:hypothetical protein